MSFLKWEKIDQNIFRIIGVTGEYMYLVVGEEKAVLVDTGCGVGDLKGLIETLTDKSVFVLLTHGHVDHAMGTLDFDTVYMNEKDMDVFQEHGNEEFRKHYIESNFVDVEKAYRAMMPCDNVKRFEKLNDKDIFDLGGLHIEVFECGGHTPGSVCILIVEKRMLLLGDACNPTTILFLPSCLSVSEYQKNLQRLCQESYGKYDTLLFSHGEPAIKPGVIETVLDVCDDILNGQDDGITFTALNVQGWIAKTVDENFMRVDGKMGNIVYNKNHL